MTMGTGGMFGPNVEFESVLLFVPLSFFKLEDVHTTCQSR